MARPESYISVDIEADGPIPGEYSMLSLGAASVDKPERSFYVELRPISDRYVADALAVSGLDRDRLIEEGSAPESAMTAFLAWIDEAAGKPVFVSFSSWDWIFVYYYLLRFGGRSPFGHSSLDLKSFYMGAYGSSWAETGKRHIARNQPQLLEGVGPHTHNALDDAREQAELFRRMLPQRS